MEKIRVYVLTKTDTGVDFEPCHISVHPTFDDAQTTMFTSVQQKTGFSDFDEIHDGYCTDELEVYNNYAMTKNGNRCYWSITPVDMENPMIPMLVRYAFRHNSISEDHRQILERVVNEVGTEEDFFDAALEGIFHEKVIGESLYENAVGMITDKDDDETMSVVHGYLNLELQGTWFDKMLAICDAELDPINTARERINEMLPAGKKLYDEDVTVEVTLPKSMLDELLASGKVTVKKN